MTDAFFMSNRGVIGIFDSGVGGLTIWKEITSLLPDESIYYIADSANAPYGTKSPNEIIDLSITNTQKLIDLGAKIIVVACNTATTQAIDVLRDKFEIPFVGIEPAIKPAALASKTRSIGVLATYGTLESEHFNTTKDKFTQDVEVVTRVGEGLVTAIENGQLHTSKLKVLLKEHLDFLIHPKTDHLVLGCTHYPLLIPIIQKIIGDKIIIVDSGVAVAMQTKRILESNNLLADQEQEVKHQLYSTKDITIMKEIVNELGFANQKNITYSSLYQSE